MLLGLVTVQADTVVETSGDAIIVDNDVPSARMEAIARARWHAVEIVAGVETQSSTVVSDFVLLDESVIQRTNGVITESQVLSESREADVYIVRIRATVGERHAQDAISRLARNGAIAISIPAILPDSSVLQQHKLTETLISRLIAAGYEVVDLGEKELGINYQRLNQGVSNNNYTLIRSLAHRHLANVVLVGTVETSHTGHKGAPDSMGPLPFDLVTARLNYRLVGGDPDGGFRTILASGHFSEKGAGNNVMLAGHRSIDALLDTAVPGIFDAVQRNVMAKTREVRVHVEGVRSLTDHQAVRDALQHIAWVAKVEAEQMGEYLVEYPERTVYLAASLHRKPGFRVVDVAELVILARYEGLIQ